MDEWQTGEHIDVPFTAVAYKARFNQHLKQLIEFDKKTKESDIVPRLLKHMLKMARQVVNFSNFPVLISSCRKHARVVDSLEAVQAVHLTEDDVEAAKKEWETMVFSDDDEN